MATYQNIFISLSNLGVLDVFVPFLLLFPIIFAIMQKTQMLGDNKKINLTLALVITLIVIVPHVLGTYPAGTDVVTIINTALPSVSLALVGAVAFVLVLAFFAKDKLFNLAGNKPSAIQTGVTFIAIGLVIAIFGNAANWWQTTGIFSFLRDPTIQALIIFLAIFWLIISSIVGTEETDEEKKKKLLYRIGDSTFGENQ